MTDEAREDVKRAFNDYPNKHPLRVLIATDAAREGVNLQNHCADLFHFDVPWNPSRVEQRNGRIDRKLQRAEEIRCHYFVYEQRPEDRVLKALVEKSKTIRRELGSLAPVLERKLEDRLSTGFARKDAAALADAIRDEQVEAERQKTAETELESGRKREADLKAEIVQLQDLLEKSREWLRLDEGDLRQAISCGLELLGARPLEPSPPRVGAGFSRPEGQVFLLPDLLARAQADPSWMSTLDTLRAPRRRGQPLWEWRKEQAVRPVVFADQGSLDATEVHLHLEHRFVQRLLGRFRSQGFVHHDLTRACMVVTRDPVPRVILLGRLSLYGERASRLHDQVLAVAARWTDSTIRSEPLKPYADATLDKTLELLEQALSADAKHDLPSQVRQRLGSGGSRDLEELRPHLKAQSDDLIARATADLRTRGDREAAEMRAILETQRLRIQKTAVEKEKDLQQPGLFDQEERKQIEADKRHWQMRLGELARELDSEPARIRQGYEV
ncbi:MAG: helicase-related protein, partial [Acidobacteriota bacterium]